MHQYEVVSEHGYFDGVQLHPRGAVVSFKQPQKIAKPIGEYRPSLKPITKQSKASEVTDNG